MSKITELAAIVEEGRIDDVIAAVDAAVEEGNAPMDILNAGLIAPINILGEKFRLGEVYVPELLISSKAMKMGVDQIKPLLATGDVTTLGKAIFCTVEGDMHDIGKNLVVLLLESAGFEVIDLGMDVEPDDIVEAVQENDDVQIVGMSAMLTTTMYAMKETIEALEEAGLRDRVKVLIGGAPVNQMFADQIGADGYTTNAPSAVELCKKLVVA
ncbi:cobalamin B12-binding domain-containing protein [Acetobacterium woodii]|uniref:Corrinoid protein MttC3 n=1 Tax=Acetobacterium woodii (strain ATCC 29683 / DSM 1030 / JCM 2381 / KCTC 1655 / WB1) TaxID=931626 RepID=H6LIH1_ACEWD|nr:corrinoid protein [Acetobacterium woodii]AFA47345.1 corrinoid protein MttC3 [Acetobacterium woodii DSM 1030]